MENLTIGENIKAELRGNQLIVTIDTSAELRTSRSGKSLIVATTSGNKRISTPKGDITIGINAYKARSF